jgi:hypothetical protein
MSASDAMWSGAFGWRAPHRSRASSSRVLSEIKFEHARRGVTKRPRIEAAGTQKQDKSGHRRTMEENELLVVSKPNAR